MTTQTPKTIKQLYEEDYCLWLETTITSLKEKQLDKLDLENLIEEIEGLMRSEHREIKSRLIVLIAHLLKWKYQPERLPLSRSSWIRTINEQREQIELVLDDSPSLRPFIIKVFPECYIKACRRANQETDLPISTFPSDSPFTLEQVLDFDYLRMKYEGKIIIGNPAHCEAFIPVLSYPEVKEIIEIEHDYSNPKNNQATI